MELWVGHTAVYNHRTADHPRGKACDYRSYYDVNVTSGGVKVVKGMGNHGDGKKTIEACKRKVDGHIGIQDEGMTALEIALIYQEECPL